MDLLLPHHATPPKPQRYLDDLHGSSDPPKPFDVGQLSPDLIEIIKRRQLRLAGLSRTDVPTFFEFTFRAEDEKRTRLRTAAHQKLVFEFIAKFPYCVIRLPTNFSKTYMMAAKGLHNLGRHPASRGAFISATEAGASKTLLSARGYIESSPDLRLVFPQLLPTEREGEPWTQSDITVRRPYGIRDPSIAARGMDSKQLLGSRLDWANVDDVLNEENTLTEEACKKTTKWFKQTVMTRFRHESGRCPVTNTPWHEKDLTYALEAIGWPSLTMDVWGGVWFKNAEAFDSDEIRPSRDAAQEELETGKPADACRLAAHDRPEYSFAAVPRNATEDGVDRQLMEDRSSIEWVGDVEECVPLWPELFGTEALIRECLDMGGPTSNEWARSKLMKPRSDEDRRVQESWIEQCKGKARERGYFGVLSSWRQGGAFTGVDLGFGKSKKSGNVAIFSFALLEDRHRLLLDVDIFKYPGGKATLARIQSHHDRFQSVVGIESNAAQRLLKEWAIEQDVTMRVRSFETNKNKHHPSFGVESIFLELENGAWLIPSDKSGRVKPDIAHWLADCTGYKPGAHTGDGLMASWIAKEQARAMGALKKGRAGMPDVRGIMSR